MTFDELLAQARATKQTPTWGVTDPSTGQWSAYAPDESGFGYQGGPPVYVDETGFGGGSPASMRMLGPTAQDKVNELLYGAGPGQTMVLDALRQIAANDPNLGKDFNWDPYAESVARASYNQFNAPYQKYETPYANAAYGTLSAAMADHPELAQYAALTAPGSDFWNSGEQARQADIERAKASKMADYMGLATPFLGALGAGLFGGAGGLPNLAPAGGAAGEFALGTGGLGAASGLGAAGVTAADIAGAVGIPELGLIANPETANAAIAAGIPEEMLSGGAGAISLGSAAAPYPADQTIPELGLVADPQTAATAIEQGIPAEMLSGGPGAIGLDSLGLGDLHTPPGLSDMQGVETPVSADISGDLANQADMQRMIDEYAATAPTSVSGASTSPTLGSVVSNFVQHPIDTIVNGISNLTMDQALMGGLGIASAINSYQNAQATQSQNAANQAAAQARQAQIDNPGAPQFTMNRQQLNPQINTRYGMGPMAQFFTNTTPQPIQRARGGLSSMTHASRPRSALKQVAGPGGGQADQIPAMLSDGEYVMDADVVAALGDGSNEKGAQKLDKMRENIRAHKRAAPVTKIPPKAKRPEQYMKGKS